MTTEQADGPVLGGVESTGTDRRRLLQIGAAAGVAAWVAPDVFTMAAHAQGTLPCVPVTLDWNDYTIGSSFTSAVVGGVTVSVATVATGAGVLAANNLTITNSPSGGIPTQSLLIAQNALSNGVGQDVTFTFSAPVTNLSFTLTDIDNATNAWIDRLTILTAGYTFAFAAPTLVAGDGTALTPFISTQANPGLPNTDNRGNVTLTWVGPVSAVTIRYRNGNVNGTTQLVRVTPINFDPC